MIGIEYNPSLVTVTFGAIDLASSNGDDIVAISFDENAVTRTMGSQGEWVWTVNQNRGGKAKVSLLLGSPASAQLSALCMQSRDRRAKLVRKAFMVKDLNGFALAVAPQAVIEKMPDISRKKSHEPVEWNFDIGEWKTINNGGTSQPQPNSGTIVSSIRGIVGL